MEVGSELFPKKKKKYLFKDGSEADGLRGRRGARKRLKINKCCCEVSPEWKETTEFRSFTLGEVVKSQLRS